MSALPLVLALGALASPPQELAPPRFDPVRLSPTPLATAALPAASTPAAPDGIVTAGEAEERGVTWKKVAHRVGGALVGGWLGYVGAQVVLSDWEKDTNWSFLDQRYSWAAAGAVAGIVASHLIRGTGPGRVRVEPRPDRDRSFLGTEEIRSAAATNAYELIYNTRMQWLITRGQNTIGEATQGTAHSDFVITVTPGRDRIIVYMDDIRLGGVDALHDISTDLLTSAEFLDAREATQRYGGGHLHGAILLSTGVSP